MADEKPTPGGAGTNWIALAAALISAIFVSLHHPPLEGLRPAAPQQKVDNVGGLQAVPARLWQDPLGAIATANVGTSTSALPPKGLYVSDTAFKKKLESEKNRTVLMVPLPGSFSPEDIEARRRARYAVLTGLHAQGYVPDSETRIGLLAISDTQDTADAPGDPSERSGNNRIAFEKFVKTVPDANATESRSIVLLWLNEDHLVQRRLPLNDLATLICRLSDKNPLSKPEWIMLGPTTSTTLRQMIIEARNKPLPEVDDGQCASRPLAALQDLKIYNYAATVADADIEIPNTVPKNYQRCRSLSIPAGREAFESLKISYFRTVATDETLSCELYSELRRRLSSSDGSESHILLISEWDSTYGRQLPDTLEAVFRSRAKEGKYSKVVFHRASYLRGLDGQNPGVSDNKSSSAAPRGDRGNDTQTRSDTASADRDERATGESQYDYLRRLGEQIGSQNQSLKRHGAEIAAIGVVGSDVYDKLTIMQALKPMFPRALFFTTDLDSLLLPQGKRRYTRNLIVATAFDRRLRDEIQGDSPPFRGSYQASAFLATRLAISDVEAGIEGLSPGEFQRRANQWFTPLLFEIGRTTAVRLPTDRLAPSPVEGCSYQPTDEQREMNSDKRAIKLLTCATLHPEVQPIFPSLPGGGPGAIAFCILAASTVLLIVGVFSSATGTLRGKLKCGSAAVWIAAIGVAACVIASSFWSAIWDWMTGHGLGEPLFFAEGVSLWPPTLIRVLGAILALMLLTAAFRKLQDNLRETRRRTKISRNLLLDDLPDDLPWGKRICSRLRLDPTLAPHLPRWSMRLAESLKLNPGTEPPPPKEDDPGRPSQSIEKILIDFSYGGRKGARILRAGLATVATYVLFYLLCVIFGWPDAPARSDLAAVAYMAATQVDVILALFLMFIVVDATLFSRAFIRRLTVAQSNWPDATKELFRAELSMLDGDIDDWIDLRFMAERTVAITQLVYYPLIALGFLTVARSTIFADFTFSVPILIMSLLNVALLTGSVIALRGAAERARAVARNEVTKRLIAANGEAGARARQLEALLRLIDGLREGAFAPWSSQPIVRAVLVPLLAYSGTNLLQLFAFPGT